MKYSLFIGKWQPFHKGHKWLIEERLKLGKNILIGIREIENPLYSPSEIKMQVFELFPDEVNVGTIDFVDMPDIEYVSQNIESPNSGEIFMDDILINPIDPSKRDIAMVFQNYALYPQMTVKENMAFGLKIRKFLQKETSGDIW